MSEAVENSLRSEVIAFEHNVKLHRVQAELKSNCFDTFLTRSLFHFGESI